MLHVCCQLGRRALIRATDCIRLISCITVLSNDSRSMTHSCLNVRNGSSVSDSPSQVQPKRAAIVYAGDILNLQKDLYSRSRSRVVFPDQLMNGSEVKLVATDKFF